MAYVDSPAGQVVGVVPDAAEDPNLPYDLLQIVKKIEKRLMGVYANAASRDTAAGAAGLEEGMFAFLKGSDSVTYYDGTQWKVYPVAPPTFLDGHTAPANTLGVDGDIYFQW